MSISAGRVQDHLEETTIDLVSAGSPSLRGYDRCFGHGRVDALRAVTGDDDHLRETVNAPMTDGCPQYR